MVTEMADRYVTIGMPTYNGASTIEQTLQDILDQALPLSVDEMEVIVCANSCTDGTEKIVESIASDNNCLELISTSVRGRPHAWKTIRNRAKSNTVVYINDDIRLGDEKVVKRLYEDLEGNSDIQI